ncbi:MAG TPA: tRNA adenosine(34) deaminase TadA [Tepidisphaeraceae bacterium]
MNEQANQWMRLAIAEAHKALAFDEVPIGAIVVHEPSGQIVGRGYNRRQSDRDPTGHAELFALREAGKNLNDWRLVDCIIIVTLEPCPMCAGAIVNSRVAKLIYGCDDPKAGAVRTLFQLCEDSRLNHRVEVVAGILAEECAQLLTTFFRDQRALGKK